MSAGLSTPSLAWRCAARRRVHIITVIPPLIHLRNERGGRPPQAALFIAARLRA